LISLALLSSCTSTDLDTTQKVAEHEFRHVIYGPEHYLHDVAQMQPFEMPPSGVVIYQIVPLSEIGTYCTGHGVVGCAIGVGTPLVKIYIAD